MQYRVIMYGTAEYQQSLELRHTILRIPLGMDLFDGSYDDLSQEARYFHFGALDTEGQLIASVLGIPTALHEIRIKQMVVATQFQGQGIGKRLFMAFEAYLLNLGFTRFVLHARMTAHGFYLNLGYEISGEAFQEVGMPHFKMIKSFAIPVAEQELQKVLSTSG